jgi:hypothetical protein
MLTILISTTFSRPSSCRNTGTPLALFPANSGTTRLASRGGRNRSSTRFTAWGVNSERGVCTSPLLQAFPVRCVVEVVFAGYVLEVVLKISNVVERAASNRPFLLCAEQLFPDPTGSGFRRGPRKSGSTHSISIVHIPLREISDRPKKMSGRWGFRPLWRGGWRVYNQKLSPADPIGPLRSRAATRCTGANTLSPCLPPSAKLNFRLPFHPGAPPLPRR